MNNNIDKVLIWLGKEELPWSKEIIMEKLEMMEKSFLADFCISGGAFLSPEQETLIQKWNWSIVGRETEARLCQQVALVFEKIDRSGLTAHDIRHVLLTTYETRQVLELEGKMDDWQKWAILGNLMHDWGRVVEEKMATQLRAKGEIPNWKNDLHGRLSFLVASEFFDGFPDMPGKLRGLILFSILTHSGYAGAYESPGVLSALVQSGDRSQLIGTECFYRMLQNEVNERNFALVMTLDESENQEFILGKGRRKSLPTAMEFFWRRVNLIGSEVQIEREFEMKKITGSILYHLIPDMERKQVFYPEIQVYDQGNLNLTCSSPAECKPLMSQELWLEIKQDLTEQEQLVYQRISQLGIRELVEEIFVVSGSASSTAEIEKMSQKMENDFDADHLYGFKKAAAILLDSREDDKLNMQKRIKIWSEDSEKNELSFSLNKLVIELINKNLLV